MTASWAGFLLLRFFCVCFFFFISLSSLLNEFTKYLCDNVIDQPARKMKILSLTCTNELEMVNEFPFTKSQKLKRTRNPATINAQAADHSPLFLKSHTWVLTHSSIHAFTVYIKANDAKQPEKWNDNKNGKKKKAKEILSLNINLKIIMIIIIIKRIMKATGYPCFVRTFLSLFLPLSSVWYRSFETHGIHSSPY